MTDRTIRNLAHLRRSASTARVLNLLNVYNEHQHDPDWAARPLFRSPALNRALIIKHRLRRDELDLFHLRRQVATKVILPIDSSDLKTGGHFVFVGQRGFEPMMQEAFGIGGEHPDLATLTLLDRLPSLDPFLLREQLRRAGIELAPCYFTISEHDMERMLRFVEDEIRPLVTLSIGYSLSAVGSTRRLAGRILSSDPRDRMEALRQTLQLDPGEYDEGVFCWKGFLYYKWVLGSLAAEIADVADALGKVRTVGAADQAAREYLDRGRTVLRGRIQKTSQDVALTLRIYDDAYASLTVLGDPSAFRDFLLRAPGMFNRLGDQLGAIQHIVSFWRFRFGPGSANVSPEELIDIFMDFETGLAGRDEEPGTLILAA
ncbi:hypothetical protein [Brevundimonas sp.]|uniref:hypothetical protein n=1 Tax=Brevundimonas sp. TaxID=1871086 RepID=UPI002FC5DD8F